jgi:hypothetical protein
MDQRRTTAAVMKDIIDAKAMAEKHVRKTRCPAHVDQQTHESPFGGYYTQPLLRVTAVPDGFEPVPDDEWEPWMGPGGQEYVAENPEIKPALNKLYRACEYIDLARAALETGEDA